MAAAGEEEERASDARDVFAVAHAYFTECQVVATFIDAKIRARVDTRAPAVPHGIIP